MAHTVHLLQSCDRAALHHHFAQLSPDDLFMRFGRTPDAAWLHLVIDGFDFTRDTVLGVRDGADWVGVAHLALFDGAAELGVSVLSAARRRGVATALFIRAALRARDHGVNRLYVRDLPRNRAMCQIARRAGMRIHADNPGNEAWIELPSVLSLIMPQGADIKPIAPAPHASRCPTPATTPPTRALGYSRG